VSGLSKAIEWAAAHGGIAAWSAVLIAFTMLLIALANFLVNLATYLKKYPRVLGSALKKNL
jgi:hypothetical protein